MKLITDTSDEARQRGHTYMLSLTVVLIQALSALRFLLCVFLAIYLLFVSHLQHLIISINIADEPC